jgi:hypothetical protein
VSVCAGQRSCPAPAVGSGRLSTQRSAERIGSRAPEICGRKSRTMSAGKSSLRRFLFSVDVLNTPRRKGLRTTNARSQMNRPIVSGEQRLERANCEIVLAELDPLNLRRAATIVIPRISTSPKLLRIAAQPTAVYLGNLNPPREYPKTRETRKSMIAM